MRATKTPTTQTQKQITSFSIDLVSLTPANHYLKWIFILLTLEFIPAYYGPIFKYVHKLTNRKYPKYLHSKQYELKIYTFL